MKESHKVGDVVDIFGFDTDIKWWERIYYRTQGRVNDVKYWFKKKYQKVKYGFTLEESWNFDSKCAEWCLPRLKHFRSNIMSIPSVVLSEKPEDFKQLNFEFYETEYSFDAEKKKWEDILDKIIWSFEHYHDAPEPIYPDNYDHRWVVAEIDERGPAYKNADEREIDFSPVFEHERKVEEGLELFGKYFRYLQD